MKATLAGPVDEVTQRIVAPNPSPMTLDGTNSYLLGRPGSGEVVVVDPGPDMAVHRRAIEDAARRADAQIVAVIVTHHHHDHAEAAGWSTIWRAPLYAFDPSRVTGAVALADAAQIRCAGLVLRAVHTPGHTSDHLCLQVADTGAVLAGDHVLGRGTSVVAWPDGDLRAYLSSLRRIASMHATRLDPGHGPSIADPARVIAEYLAHRRERDEQILDAVEAGPATPAEIVADVYADVDPGLHLAAERSVRAHLVALADAGRVRILGTANESQPRFGLTDHSTGRAGHGGADDHVR